MPRQLSRRSMVGSCIAAATGVLGATAAAQSSFSPEISFADDGMSVDVRGQDVETVTLTTKDGSTHTFDGDLGRYGYNRSSPEPIEGWHGTIEQVEASNGSETKVRLNPHYRLDLSVGCSTYETAEDVAELRLDFEHATKTYDPPQTGRGRQPAEFGSPGRSLQEIVKMDNEMCITRNGGCSPPGGQGVTFDCTSVTVSAEEFLNAEAACYDVELTFADGTTELVGEAGERFEPPVTFSGSGENEGKVIQSLGFSYDESGGGWFHYDNPDAGACDPASTAAGDEQASGADDASGDANATETGDADATTDSTADADATTESDDAETSDADATTDDTDATADDSDSGGSLGGDGGDGGSDGTDATASDDGTSDDGGVLSGDDGGSTADAGSTTESGSTDDASTTDDTGSTDGGSDSSDGGDSTDDGNDSSDGSAFNWRDLYHKW